MRNGEHNTRDHKWSVIFKNEGLILTQCECPLPPQETRSLELGPLDSKGMATNPTRYELLYKYLAGDPEVKGSATGMPSVQGNVQFVLNDPYDQEDGKWIHCDFCGPAHKKWLDQVEGETPPPQIFNGDNPLLSFPGIQVTACFPCVESLIHEMLSGGG